MNEIKLKVNFGKRTIARIGTSLTTGDYNSTKIIFEFDREDGRKVFEMINPNNELVFSDEIVNNEIILVGKAEVTTIHNDVTYTKYLDDQENVYWYDKETEKIYDSEFIETTEITLDELEVVTEDASLFTMAGRYIFEISLYDGNSKLTSKSDYLDVKEEQVIIDGNTASLYLPIFDKIFNEIGEIENNYVKFTDSATDEIAGVIKLGNGFKKDINGRASAQSLLYNGYQSASISQFISKGTLENVIEGKGLVDSSTLSNCKLSDFTDDLGNSPVHTHSQYLTEHQDISMKQNIEDNTLNTNSKTIPTAINEVNSIAKGANQAIAFPDYYNIVTAFNLIDEDYFRVGQNVYVIALNVPDLWISKIETTSVPYTYTTDEAFINDLTTNGYVQVGYYKLSVLETQKVDLTNYVQFTDYASDSNGGVIKTSGYWGTITGSTGHLLASIIPYSSYPSKEDNIFISKGTLENVIAGKGLTTKSYVDGLVGDIATALDTIQGEVI